LIFTFYVRTCHERNIKIRILILKDLYILQHWEEMTRQDNRVSLNLWSLLELAC
jgi:hypothetical protein